MGKVGKEVAEVVTGSVPLPEVGSFFYYYYFFLFFIQARFSCHLAGLPLSSC